PANRLQSYNFQDRYVRHTNFDVRIDQNVTSEDAQFRLRTGLVGSGTVSFESVNFPGYFLRQDGTDFQLVHNDGTSQFAQDATFNKVAGLADATWSSFQSYNHPDRYIRHYAFELKLDPITNATGRSDATFRVTS
ncbi:AbfB domain-containing protein, partial [Streptomyces sp. Root264]|uniref:AbfB domain-containing protein n=3 Tax=Streptomyces TaxID=1883 RepID=UPI001F5B1488